MFRSLSSLTRSTKFFLSDRPLIHYLLWLPTFYHSNKMIFSFCFIFFYQSIYLLLLFFQLFYCIITVLVSISLYCCLFSRIHHNLGMLLVTRESFYLVPLRIQTLMNDSIVYCLLNVIKIFNLQNLSWQKM